MTIKATIQVVQEGNEPEPLFGGLEVAIEVGIPKGRIRAERVVGDWAYLRLFTDPLFEPDVIVPAEGGLWAIVPGRTTANERVDWHIFSDSSSDKEFESFL